MKLETRNQGHGNKLLRIWIRSNVACACFVMALISSKCGASSNYQACNIGNTNTPPVSRYILPRALSNLFLGLLCHPMNAWSWSQAIICNQCCLIEVSLPCLKRVDLWIACWALHLCTQWETAQALSPCQARQFLQVSLSETGCTWRESQAGQGRRAWDCKTSSPAGTSTRSPISSRCSASQEVITLIFQPSDSGLPESFCEWEVWQLSWNKCLGGMMAMWDL